MKPYMKTTLSLAASLLVIIVALLAVLLIFGGIDWAYAVDFLVKSVAFIGVMTLAGICLGLLAPTNRK